LLDQPYTDPRTLAANLRDLRLLNRSLGWTAGVWEEVRLLLPRGAWEATLLDVATGSADLPRALRQRAAARGIWLHVIGTDVGGQVLVEAARHGADLALVRHDATRLPFADGAVDVATLCLAAHHLDPPALQATLRELWRVCRRGVVVSDLERGAPAYLGARLMALALRNRLTAHDGPVSVLRAYTAPELHALARRAGLEAISLRRRFPFRLTLVAVKPA